MDTIQRLEPRMMLSVWYVSPTGSNAASGIAAHPFQTIQQAASVAQPGDTVLIRGGTYHETVTPTQSGTASKPITYKAVAGQTVVIDGADPINNWQPSGNQIQAQLSASLGEGEDQVFLNHQMLAEARWPNDAAGNADPFQSAFAQATAVSIGPNTETGLATATLTVPNLTDPAGTWVGATIHIAPGSQWVWQTGTVIASGPGQLTFSYQPLTPYSYQIPTLGNPFYLTGAPAALDAPGEWTINPASHVLSLIPSDGNTPAAGAVEVKQRLYGFDLSGLSYINISNLNFFACTINTSAASTHITINNITARYVSNDFNKPDPWADQYLPHTSGIILNGTNNLLENSIINYSSCDGVYLGGSNNTVRNCSVSNADYAGADEAGITTSGANEQVLFNTVYNCGRNGIDIRYSPAASILNNRIYNVGLLTTDMGGIYTFNTDGQETVIANNLISDIHAGGFGGAGIHLDNGSSSYIVHNNVVWNADTALKMNPPSQNNVIVNNTFIGTLASIDGNGSTGMTGSMLVNNIFIGPVGTVGADLTESNDLFNDASVKFVNPPKNDFRLLRGSAGIHTGRALPPYAVTIGKFPPDIGAYAYGKKPFTNGARIAPPLNRLFLRL